MAQPYSDLERRLSSFISRRCFITGATALSSYGAWMKSSASATPSILGQLKFFTLDEYRFVEAASERILPYDENGPGAQDLHVALFIDRQMQTPYGHGALWYLQAPFVAGPPELNYQLPYTPRQLYRHSIHEITQYCLQNYHNFFHALSTSQQEEILSQLEKNYLTLNDISGSIFFEQLRSNTLEGAFSDPLYGGNYRMGGWRMLGFPGARADFMDWINQQGAPYPLGPVAIPSSVLISKDLD